MPRGCNSGVFVGDSAAGVVIANVDGDPRGEILVPRASSGWVIVEWADAGALEVVGSYGSGAPPLHTLDLDGDGDLDMISHGVTTVDIWRNQGTGGFSYEAIRAASCVEPYQPGDYTGDGRPDLLCGDLTTLELYAGGCGTPPPALRPTATLMRPCAADVSFEETVYWLNTDLPERMRVDDITGDARPDVVLSGQAGAEGGNTVVSVLRQAPTGGGALTAAAELPLTSAAGGFVLADLDSDGTSEVVTTSGAEGWSIVRDDMRGPSPPVYGLGALSDPLAGDFDGDRGVDLAFVRGDSADGRLVVVPGGDASAAFEIGGLGTRVWAPLGVDLDQDGGTDIVVTIGTGGPTGPRACVLWSPVTASSTCATTGARSVDIGPMLGFGWIGVAAGSFVGSSAPDFVVSARGRGIALFEGAGAGLPPSDIASARAATLVPLELMTVVDLDGDGRDDVIGIGRTTTGIGTFVDVMRACGPTR